MGLSGGYFTRYASTRVRLSHFVLNHFVGAHMLRISKDQLEELRQDDAIFTKWYIDTIMKNYFPQYYFSVSDEGKREMVLNGRRYAREHGLETAEAQGHFLGLMWDIGANFYLFPGFRDVLKRTDLEGMEKINLLFDGGVTDAHSRAAINGSDDSYWYREDVEAVLAEKET